MSSHIALKVTLPHRVGRPAQTRKLVHPRSPPPKWVGLYRLVKERFGLAEDFSLTWEDSDGDIITLSSDDELAELFASLDDNVKLVRFEITVHDPVLLSGPTSSYAQSHADSDIFSQPASSILDVPVLAFSRLSTEEAETETRGSDLAESYARSVAESEGTDVPDTGVDKGKARAISLTDEELSWAHIDMDDANGMEYGERASTEDARSTADRTPAEEAVRTPSPTPTVVADSPSPPAAQVEDPAEAEPDTQTEEPTTPTRASLPLISAILNAIPAQAEHFATHFTPLLNNPTQEHLASLLGSAPRGLPNLARDVVSEVNNAVNEALQRFRREADGLRREFREVTEELQRVREDRRAANTAASATPTEATASPLDEQAEERRRAKIERKEKMWASLEKARERRRVEKEQIKAQILEDTALEAEVASTASPFDDVYGVEESSQEPQTGRSRRTRDHATSSHHHGSSSPRRRRGPKSPSSDSLPLPSVAAEQRQASDSKKDDFFLRRFGMPGAFTTIPSKPIVFTEPQSVPPQSFSGPALQPSTSTSSAPASASERPFLAMPGAFSFTPEDSSHPVASTSRNAMGADWAEVTPSKLKAAVSGLGFDVRDIGIRIAIERTWEENRGKDLSVMVAGVLDKIVA